MQIITQTHIQTLSYIACKAHTNAWFTQCSKQEAILKAIRNVREEFISMGHEEPFFSADAIEYILGKYEEYRQIHPLHRHMS